LFITGYDKESKQLMVACLDRHDGRVMWQDAPAADAIEPVHEVSSPASATPVTDGRHVYVFFGSIGLLCYDYQGNERWRVPLGPFGYMFDWGEAASPVLCGDAVIQNCDNDDESFLISVNKRTGTINWRTERPLATVSYATPTVWKSTAGTRLAVAGSGALTFYDPANGSEIAQVTGLPRIVNPTPIVADGLLYVMAYSRGEPSRDTAEVLMTFKDKNKDGMLSKDELPESMSSKFARGDTDKDGQLTREELKGVFKWAQSNPGGGEILMAIRPGGTGDITDSHVVWQYRRSIPYVPSPLIVHDRIYIAKDGGIATCVDAKTGEPLWGPTRLDAQGSYYASPVYGDGKIYFISERGVVTVVADAPEFTKLAQNDLGSGCKATPAIVGDLLYVRTDETLYCFTSQSQTVLAAAGG
jgi:outer membrane protein assembly factor BamB